MPRGRDHPRLRGEQTIAIVIELFKQGSPPLARGTDTILLPPSKKIRITPACAGNSLSSGVGSGAGWDHPRLRGEQYRAHLKKVAGKGSPPLARGTGRTVSTPCGGRRITPACAGNSPFAIKLSARFRDHPRLRGEQIIYYTGIVVKGGSPPLARGTVSSRKPSLPAFRITPACAGNSSFFNRSCCSSWDHPRLRGEQQAGAP